MSLWHLSITLQNQSSKSLDFLLKSWKKFGGLFTQVYISSVTFERCAECATVHGCAGPLHTSKACGCPCLPSHAFCVLQTLWQPRAPSMFRKLPLGGGTTPLRVSRFGREKQRRLLQPGWKRWAKPECASGESYKMSVVSQLSPKTGRERWGSWIEQMLSGTSGVPGTVWAPVPSKPSPMLSTFSLKHPFVKSAKGVSILRDLINEAMDVKLKRQEAQQREVDQDDEENSVSVRPCCGPHAFMRVIAWLSGRVTWPGDNRAAWSWRRLLRDYVLSWTLLRACWGSVLLTVPSKTLANFTLWPLKFTFFLIFFIQKSECFFHALLGNQGSTLKCRILHSQTPSQAWDSKGVHLSSLDLCCKTLF